MYKKNKTLIFALLYAFTFVIFADEPIIIPDVNVKSKYNTTKKTKAVALGTNINFPADQVAQSPSIDLDNFLQQQQSAVRLTNNSGDSSQTALSLRGFGDNAAANSLILIDGFPLTNPSLLAPNFNSIPLSDIDHIDIFPGSAGTLWGDQAVGGVVNIITKHPKHFMAASIISLGSYGRTYANFILGDKNKYGIYFKTFGVIDQTQNYRQHNRQSDNNIAGQIGWDYAHGTILLNAQTYATTNNFPGGLTLQQYLQDPQQAINYKNYSYARTAVLQLLSKHELNTNWLIETRLLQQQTNGNGFMFNNYERLDKTTRLEQRFIGQIQKSKITAGYAAQLSEYEFQNLHSNNNAKAKQFDVFAENVYPISKKLDLSFGLRSAWQDNSVQTIMLPQTRTINEALVSEQGLQYQFNKNLSLYLRRDGNFSFPKANEQTWLPKNINSLDPQIGTSYEAGLNYNTQKLNLQVGVYRLDLHDEIAFDPTQTPDQPFGAFSNLDNTRRYGLTFNENYYLTEKALLYAQLNLVNARFASGAYNGNYIPAVPAINANIGLNYQWSEHWQTQYTAIYTGTRYPSEDVANIAGKLPAYWLNNFSIQYLFDPWIVSFEANNIFNTQYPSYAIYTQFDNSTTYYPAMGRNFLLTIKLNID